ncbi:MAG: 16S rRNA (cytosine(967)-C(5))-methyltransferase RsmB [Christensenellaceae bacterium]|nr:16S rRNA (cytosine(967)-C(5))-methyltransferase RsmB [Christensenellaceae bacterium]
MTNRRIAFNILNRVICEGAYANLALKDELAGMHGNAASAITALVYNTIERINYADFLLHHYVTGRLHGSIRLVLRMGISELLFMKSPVYAVCDESVKLTKDIGKAKLSGFVNAVLRRIDRERDSLPDLPEDATERFNILYGVPRFMAKEYISLYGEGFTESLLKSNVHSVTIRAQYPFTSMELEAYLNAKGISYHRGRLTGEAFILESGIDVINNELFAAGKIAVQSESAMLASLACGAGEGDRVLDVCGAPGGKTAYLASIMHDNGSITTWDIHSHRVDLTKSTLDRLHVSIARASQHDASELEKSFIDSMDVVLVDAPCSGLGGGSKPDAYLNRTERSIFELSELQNRILGCCCKYVKAGGVLVYSTCTISKRENEDNILRFLNTHEEFGLDSLEFCLPDGYVGRSYSGMIQLFPNMDGVDGFFIARMKRRAQDGGHTNEA